jgi:signal peptidase II
LGFLAYNAGMIIFAAVAALMLAGDLLSKYFTDGVFDVVVIKGVFSFHSAYNRGVAFSLFSGSGTILIVVTAFFALLGIIAYFWFRNKKKNEPLIWFLDVAAGLFAAGAFGNLIDRIFLGYVRDFIRTDFMNFPIFNFADICINIGAILVVIYFIFIYKDEKTAEKTAKNAGKTAKTAEKTAKNADKGAN